MARRPPAWEAEVLAQKDRNARVWKRKIWQWARANPRSALHSKFDWDLNRAAQEAWDARAGELIRALRIQVTYEERPLPVPTPRLVADVIANESSYIDIVVARENATFKKASLDAELERIRHAIRRGYAMALYYRDVRRFKRELATIVADETQ